MDEVQKHRGSTGPYRSPAWLFARVLKGHPEFAFLDAEDATDRVDAEVEAMFPDSPAPWVSLGLPDFDSRDHGSDPQTDFLTVWDSVEKPFELGARVKEAAERADEKPLDFGERFRSVAYRPFVRLLSICYWLGQLTGGEFFLSARDAGDVLGVSPTTANQLLRRAEKVGFLEPVGTYTEKDRARRKAKSWRFKPPSPLRFLAG